MYYFGARYYDPATERFITRDTFPGFRSNPQSLNKYSYCQNNPLKYTDPTGNIAEYVDDVTTIIATLYLMYVAAPQMERLFTNLQSLGAVILAPPPTSTPSEVIEQYRDQAWNNYGTYQGSSNPTTILDQTPNNGITNQADEEKIHEGQQAKHDASHANYRLSKKNEQYKSPLFDPQNAQSLLDSGKGTGVYKTGIPPAPGSSEYVKWKEWIGLAVPPGGGQSVFTMWGKIHYGSRGHHIVPGPPVP